MSPLPDGEGTRVATRFRLIPALMLSSRPTFDSFRAAVWALLAIGLAVFLNSLGGTFVFDDTGFIRDDSLDITSLDWLTSEAESPMKGRPLAGLTFVVNHAVCGDKPVGYHLFNTSVHVTCALVLLAVVRRALLRNRTTTDSNATATAFACALLWMIHPLQTECVNYVSQRTESMAAFFVLASFYCAMRADETTHRARWIVLAGVSAWAGIMCKEITAVGPVLIALYDFAFRDATKGETLRGRWPLYAALFSSWLPLAGLMCLLPRTVTVGTSEQVTIGQYALNQCVLIVEYFRLVFWPDRLLIDYGRPWQVSWSEALPCLAVVLALAALTLAVYHRHPKLGFLGAWVFLLLAPTSSVIPINTEVGAERRMYLPLAAIVVLVVLGAKKLTSVAREWVEGVRVAPSAQPSAGGRGSQRVAIVIQCALLAGLAVALGARTIDRNADYADPLKLWTQAVEERPWNRRAWSNLASQFRKIDAETAAHVLEEMTRRWPNDAKAHYEVAMYHRVQENFAEAVRYFRRVSELDSSNVESRRRLVWLLAACADDDVRDGGEALRLARGLMAAEPRSSRLLDALGVAHAECGNFEAAIETIELALEEARESGEATVGLEQRLGLYREGKPCRFGGTTSSRGQT